MKKAGHTAVPRSPRGSLPTSPRVSLPSSSKVSVPTSPKASLPTSPKASLPTSPRASLTTSPKPSLPTSPKASLPTSPKASVPTSPKEETKVKNLENRKVEKRKKPAVLKNKVEAYVEAASASIADKPKQDSEKALLSSALSKHFIFASLSPEHQSTIIAAMKYYRLPAREIIFEQGKPAINFFVLVSGRVEVLVGGRQVNVLKEGEGFGELALLHDTPRSATIRSLEACTLWAVDGKTFRLFLTTVNQQSYSENKAFITSIPLFAPLTPDQKEALTNVLTSQQFLAGQKIVNEGDPGDLCYIIKDGTVSCTKGGVEVRRLGKGEFFGEQALLNGGFRTASVTAVEGAVKCVSIGRSDLVQVLGNSLQLIIYRNTQRMAFEKNEILRCLTKDQVDRVIGCMRVATYSNGEIVVPLGTQRGIKLWVVLKGAVGMSSGKITAETLSCVGEVALTQPPGGVYSEPLVAIGETVHVAEIGRSMFEECLGGGIEIATANNETMEVLRRVPLLRKLARDRLSAILPLLRATTHSSGNIIVQQGDPGDTLFILKSGKVDVFKDGANIRTVTKHDYFGERAVLFDEIRSATVVARGDVACWTLKKSEFLGIVDEGMRNLLMQRISLQDDSIGLHNLIIVKTLGKGNFGNVFLTINPEKGTLYALKTVTRKKIEAYEIEENIIQERRILLQLDHMLIVKLIKTFKDAKRLYFLMEFVCGQDLFDVLREMGLLNNMDARFYIGSLLLMLEHLHERDIIYRDLKPENVMIDESGYPRLIDFGTAKIIQNRTYTIVGTPHYMAPEVIMGKGYGLQADIYSVGILLYEFVCGAVPFGEEEADPYAIYEEVLAHRIRYPEFVDPRMACRPFIEQLLSVNPALRLGGSIDHLKSHKWFNSFNWVRPI